jgi:hypothetical protein
MGDHFVFVAKVNFQRVDPVDDIWNIFAATFLKGHHTRLKTKANGDKIIPADL